MASHLKLRIQSLKVARAGLAWLGLAWLGLALNRKLSHSKLIILMLFCGFSIFVKVQAQ